MTARFRSPIRPLAVSALALLGATGLACAEPSVAKSIKSPAPGLYELAVSPSTNTVFVAAAGGRGATEGKILKFDAKTLEAKGEISVGDKHVFGLGINEKTQTLYGTSTRAGQVTAVDIKTGKVVADIKPDGATGKPHVREVLVDEEANLVYISVFGSAPREARPATEPGGRDRPASPGSAGQIWVIDGATNTVKAVIDQPGLGVIGLAVDKADNRLYTTDMSSNEVIAIDLTSHKVIGKYPSGGEAPMNIDLDAKRGLLFVANQKSGTVGVLSAKDGSLVKTVPTGEGSLAVEFDEKSEQVFVTNRNAGTTTVIDPEKLEPVANLDTGTLPQSIAVDQQTGLVYITNKARGRPRGAPETEPVPEDPNGDTLVIVHP